MTSPMQVAVVVEPLAQPVVDFLLEHSHDIGSCEADRFKPQAQPGERLLCVHLVDHDAMADLSYRMQQAWMAEPELIELTNAVAVVPTPVETLLLVFLNVRCFT